MKSEILTKAVESMKESGKGRGPRREVNFDEELPLVLAFLRREITMKSGMEAYGYSSHSAFVYRVMQVLREAFREKKVEITEP